MPVYEQGDPLTRMLEREHLAEILALLEPLEVIIAFLRTEGHTDQEIAELLHARRPAITKRMIQARRRIAACLPEAGSLLRGRSPSRRPQQPGDEDNPHLTSSELARWLGVSRTTVVRWCLGGYLPNAYREGDGHQRWRIPLHDVEHLPPWLWLDRAADPWHEAPAE